MDFVFSQLMSLIGFVGAPAFYMFVGLMIGWNVLAQPAWVKNLYDKVGAYVKSKLA
jgi:hypothetical protein